MQLVFKGLRMKVFHLSKMILITLKLAVSSWLARRAELLKMVSIVQEGSFLLDVLPLLWLPFIC